jgi:hypothetical protein
MSSKKFYKTPLAIAVSTVLLQSTALAYESPVHVFSVDDVMGGFDGSTFGTAGAEQDTTIICSLGSEPCPADNQPFLDKSGVMLYPVDSEFGYYVVDFLGAQDKARDGDYLEGFVGNIVDGTEVIGIQVANAPTLKYKVKPPLGTWCQGLGGTSVKCETEHYTVMEHVLTCYETIPYWFADPVTGTQKVLSTPDGSLTYNCADAPLDDNTLILVDGLETSRLTSAVPGDQMDANDKTDMLNDVALSSDYSVQLKDDGKPLYGWGGVHKRPNDVRMYARLALPDAWKVPGADYLVTKAQLVVNHWITNNPNDQLRPEDLENEAATGRKPSYRIEGTPGEDDEVWKSLDPCYEGDGDFIEGESPATPIGAGTVLKNMPYALDPLATPGDLPVDDPYAFSSDLRSALTNAYYTTINRDPFEWSYVNSEEKAEGVYDFVGSSTPLSDEEMAARGLELVSGPRWRLKPNKFGQDLPGLEIPLIECSPPPFKSDNIKYEVGTPVTTVINLLDWADENSPLATSKGWVDYTANEFIEVTDGLSGNGLPITQDFDLAVYIKGDAKSTALYNAQLIVEYEGEGPQPPAAYDLAVSVSVPATLIAGTPSVIAATVTNLGPGDLAEDAVVTVTGVTNRGTPFGPYEATVVSLPEGSAVASPFDFVAPTDKSTKINWTATVSAASDTNPSNDEATAKTKVRK